MPDQRFRYPLWVRGDVDGFFGLMVDNLAQVLLIIGLCTAPFLCNLPGSLVYQRILPGVAVSLLLGNLFYGCQAHFVARRDRNAACINSSNSTYESPQTDPSTFTATCPPIDHS